MSKPAADIDAMQTHFTNKLVVAMKPLVAPPLFIPLRREWFTAFKDGSKRHEYRPYGPRWNEKTCFVGRKVTLSLGYGKQQRMQGQIISFEKSEEATQSDAWKSCYGGKDYRFAAVIGIRLLLAHPHPGKPITFYKSRTP